jgi:hypothetical protein
MLLLWATLCCLQMGHNRQTLLSNFQPQAAPAPLLWRLSILMLLWGPHRVQEATWQALRPQLIRLLLSLLAVTSLLCLRPRLRHICQLCYATTLLFLTPLFAAPQPGQNCCWCTLVASGAPEYSPGRRVLLPRPRSSFQLLWRWHHKTASLQRSPSLLARSCRCPRSIREE